MNVFARHGAQKILTLSYLQVLGLSDRFGIMDCFQEISSFFYYGRASLLFERRILW